jgi:hypothetical protein
MTRRISQKIYLIGEVIINGKDDRATKKVANNGGKAGCVASKENTGCFRSRGGSSRNSPFKKV